MRTGEAVVRSADRRHADEVVGAREKRREGGRKRPPAGDLNTDRGGDHLLLRDVHLEVPIGDGVAEDLGEGRVRDLAVEPDDVSARLPECRERFAVRLPRGHLGPDLVPREVERPGLELVTRPGRVRLRHVDAQIAHAAELGDRLVGVVERLTVPPVLVLDLLDALALDRARDDRRRLAGLERLLVRAVDRVDVVAVDLDRVPPEGARAIRVGVEIPFVHRRAALTEPVHVDDRDQVVEPVERGVLERLPLRALGDLAVPAQHPDTHGQLIELLPGDRDPDAIRESLAERARRDVDPRDTRRRVPFEDARELTVREELLVGDDAGGAVDRIEQGRRVALREDEAVVVRVLRRVEVVTEVLGEEDCHQIGGRHPGGGVARLGGRRAADGIDAQLLP